jgi:uracil-DNA glycosylase
MSNLRLNLDEWLAEDWKNIVLEAGWGTHLDEISIFLNDEYAKKNIYPLFENIFNAYNTCSFQDTRVVILGQDPYHQINQANGLCFSVPEGVSFPPSLKNINKELQTDLGVSLASGNLIHWAQQGVLLINSILTVEDSLPGSHANIGWLSFTKLILNELKGQEVCW